MRLFIAIEFDPILMDTITGIQQALKRQGFRGNFTKPENLHLTLAFIGEYSSPETVLDAMETVPFEAFPLSLSGIGNFGDLWWTGIEKFDALTAYVRRLRHALADAEIPFDRKKFSPHITLIRRASFIIRPEIVIPGSTMTVDHISLFRSDRGKNGMIYTGLGNVEADSFQAD